MSREDGFTIADVSSGLLDDDRMRALWRRLGNQADMCEAVTAHEAVLLASWRDGKRVTVTQAAPLWLSVRPEIVAALVAVGLLDRTQRLPTKTWIAWFGAANARRDTRRRSGELGGLRARGKRSQSDAIAMLSQRHSEATPDRPSVRPSVRQTNRPPRDGRKSANGPEKVGALLGGLPPFSEMVGGKPA